MDFGIKVCGITNVEDALAAVEAGADAIGINLSTTSKRCVPVSRAQAIVREIRRFAPTVVCVGVFVEQSPAEADFLAKEIGLDVIQLHGNHPTNVLASDWSRPILWVARIPVCESAEMATRLSTIIDSVVAHAGWTDESDSSASSRKLAGILVDAYTPGSYGGTGQTVAWEPLGQRHAWHRLGWAPTAWPDNLPLVLAGGLNAENVARAIEHARPAAVDVASGVELEPGIKSLEKIHAFVAAVRAVKKN